MVHFCVYLFGNHAKSIVGFLLNKYAWDCSSLPGIEKSDYNPKKRVGARDFTL